MTKKYTKTEWVDEELVEEARYDILDSDGNPIYEGVEIALATDVITAATPANAEKLNNIENGIDEIDDLLNVDGITTDNINSSTLANLLSGWIDIPFTCSYSSADAPIFVISAAGDVTGYIGVGDRIKLTQSTGGTKYFIVHAIGNYSGGATLLTVYGGTDFTLNNEAISSPYFSHAGTPKGFPRNPDKWSVVVIDNNLRFTDGTANVYIQVHSSGQISVPIGNWSTRGTKAYVQSNFSASADSKQIFVALSTSNNSVSNNVLLQITPQFIYTSGSFTTSTGTYAPNANIVAAAKTTYYLILMCPVNSTLHVRGDLVPTRLCLVDNYL